MLCMHTFSIVHMYICTYVELCVLGYWNVECNTMPVGNPFSLILLGGEGGEGRGGGESE